MKSLEGAVVAVTGASSGIGRETALLFAREGARLAIAARRLDRLEALAEVLQAGGSQCLVMKVDVLSPGEAKGFVEAAVDRFGRLDVLVNNAGFGIRGRAEEIPAEGYERLMRVNYLGMVHACQAALPVMRRQASGVLINVSSIVGHRALPLGGAYAATKAAQIRFTEALRVELAGSGVEACLVYPVGTDTEFAEVARRESGGRDSSPLGPRQSALVVAQAIVRCARRPRLEVYPLKAARIVVWLAAVFPRLMDAVLLRVARGT